MHHCMVTGCRGFDRFVCLYQFRTFVRQKFECLLSQFLSWGIQCPISVQLWTSNWDIDSRDSGSALLPCDQVPFIGTWCDCLLVGVSICVVYSMCLPASEVSVCPMSLACLFAVCLLWRQAGCRV